MNFRSGSFALSMCIAVFAGPAAASDAEGNFAVRGIGSATCAQFNASYEQADSAGLRRAIHWLQGYISASNKAYEGTFDTVPVYQPDELLSLMNAICQNNQNSRLEAAANGMVRLFEAAWLSSPSDLLSVTQEERTLPVRSAILAQVQQSLADRGLYDATVDGVYGDRTAAALRRYQTEEGFDETGLPDLPTLVDLLTNQ